LNGEY